MTNAPAKIEFVAVRIKVILEAIRLGLGHGKEGHRPRDVFMKNKVQGFPKKEFRPRGQKRRRASDSAVDGDQGFASLRYVT